ncbi:putative N-alkane-inducible cytochrome P450 [Annulohypoxylon truncatum]|uniref:putative N-alkane-inducible cytochrome P450 n=1 Tax=Annulohypoxylon truncatum TaxID=327061 RepID=UPI0020078D0A|nr:putative N-alkane-inducible cytochrome P450 [Annulohypoxylon truncatum]KAI1204810.1 putative N-alkane-inducible cytochrome P450 [Annulohypoxylon truncatum]
MARYVSSAVILLLLFITYRIVKSKLKKRHNDAKAAALGCLSPPVLRSTNLIGNSVLRESMRATKEDRGPQYVAEKMDSVSPSCHTIKVPIIDYEIIVTRDPENARALFTSADFDISHHRQLSWMPLLGKGIFTSRGDTWKHSRALLRPQFAREMISDPQLEEQHLAHLWRRLPADAATGWTGKVDLAPLFFKFTLDTSTEFIFGQSANSLLQDEQSQDSEKKSLASHFNAAKVWIDKRGALAKFYWLMNSAEFTQHCAAIHAFADGLVADRLANPYHAKQDPEKGARFSLLNELAKDTQDPRELRNETLHVLIAGRDTTGCLLGWVLYFLARHPRVYARLRAEIVDRFGETAAPDFRQLAQVSYLQWIISETLRFATVIPLNERIALRDTVLPAGGGADGKAPVFVPEGTQVLVPLYAMQHRADIWGADVEEFRPERWETHRPGWEYIPFGAGARKCLGQQFGRQEVGYVVSRFCQKYDRIENMEEGDGRIRLHHAIENRSGTGVQVRLHEAKAST